MLEFSAAFSSFKFLIFFFSEESQSAFLLKILESFEDEHKAHYTRHLLENVEVLQEPLLPVLDSLVKCKVRLDEGKPHFCCLGSAV